MKEQSYTSTTPMGRTACTEPQCLYKGDLYLYLCSITYKIDVSLGFTVRMLAVHLCIPGLKDIARTLIL